MAKTSQRNQKLAVLGVMLAALLGFGLWLFLWVEWEEHEVDLGLSDEAQRNAYLAAQQFLQGHGREVRVLKSFAIFDDMDWRGEAVSANDLVVLVGAHGVLEGQRLENLWQWLEGGGGLVLSTHNPFVDADLWGEDALLERLPVSVAFEDDTDAGIEEAPAPEDNAENNVQPNAEVESETSATDCSPFSDSVTVAEGAEPVFSVGQRAGFPVIYHGDQRPYWFQPEEEQRFVRFSVGRGDVTVSADNAIWRNDFIGCFDHAYALGRLAQDRQKVWFVINADAPSLWRLLWQWIPETLLLLSLTLVLWIWRVAKRVAPPVATTEVARRRFLEHVRASATFLWRHRQSALLIEQLRDDILQFLNARHPGMSARSPEQKAELIAQLTHISLGEVEYALAAPAPTHVKDFVYMVKRLQQIRNAL